jgi:hypothetical protein
LTVRKKQTTNKYKVNPVEEVAVFEAASACTVGVQKCLAFLVHLVLELQLVNLASLKPKCAVAEPQPNSAKCYDTYTALISVMYKPTEQNQKNLRFKG